MGKKFISITMVCLMALMSISSASYSLNQETQISDLSERIEVSNVIMPIGQLNVAGFQEGSIYTNSTLSSGGDTPAQSSTTVQSRVGDWVRKVNLAMVRFQLNILQHWLLAWE